MSYVLIDYDIVPTNKKDDQIYEFENENEGLYYLYSILSENSKNKTCR